MTDAEREDRALDDHAAKVLIGFMLTVQVVMLGTLLWL